MGGASEKWGGVFFSMDLIDDITVTIIRYDLHHSEGLFLLPHWSRRKCFWQVSNPNCGLAVLAASIQPISSHPWKKGFVNCQCYNSEVLITFEHCLIITRKITLFLNIIFPPLIDWTEEFHHSKKEVSVFIKSLKTTCTELCADVIQHKKNMDVLLQVELV